ncbi:4-hydroxy-tetrahydrodipicolinate reductase [Caldanaerovirga acetigignens]|nr:4-hydroxy-tetrahydrodipicolinate reductase [Caldanaerovirga acetigignens]
MLRAVVIGPRGKMGRLIVKSLYERENAQIIGAVAPKGADYVGKDVGLLCGLGKEINVRVTDDIESVIKKCNCIIDFTFPAVSLEILKHALSQKKALVCGTTGFKEEEKEEFIKASQEIPIVFAGNTSFLINHLYKLLEYLARNVGDYAEIDIVEMHDRFKKDAPSGTSLEMREVLKKVLPNKNVNIHSIRGGDVPSTHKIIFNLLGERLEITHHATNFQCFAEGAVRAAEYLLSKKNGFYTMKEVFGIAM